MEGYLKKTVAQKFEREIKAGAFAEISVELLAAANITPHFSLAERDPDAFAESRRLLQVEPGLVIANHPGEFDSYIILSQIERNDVKIVVSEGNYAQVVEMFGAVPLIKATSDVADGRRFFTEITEHVASGGLVLLYPTGGNDSIKNETNEPLEFQRGLGMVLKHCLRPTDMVYSFYVEPDEVRAVASDTVSRLSRGASAVAVPALAGFVTPKNVAVITAHERYATAEEWRHTMAGTSGREREERLAQHFLEQFPHRR